MRVAQLAKSVLYNRLGAVPRPAWCTYVVTFRCNARCGMCDSWKLPAGRELTSSEVATVFGKLGRLDVVRLTGGEPFLRTDLLELAESVLSVSQPAVLHITTNGSQPDRVEKLIEACQTPRRLRFMVSFDGLAEEHDHNRGRQATFERALATVRCLVDFRRRLGLEVSVNHTVISEKSLEDNAALREIMGKLSVEVHSVLAYEDSSLYGTAHHGRRAEHLIALVGYPLHPDLRSADVTGFVKRELRQNRRCRDTLLRWGKKYYLHGLLERLAGSGNGRPRATCKPRCVALRSHVRLLPDGSVPICLFNTETVGNLRTDSWEALWHGTSTRAARRWVDACPGCWAECEVMPNALYSGDLLRPWL
ncbi:MAG: radical SAM protein [Planctomycetota bacterium]